MNPDSPYEVARGEDGVLRLTLEGRDVSDVGLPPMPEYYRHELSNGKTVMETAPTIQWGYLIYLTVLRLCQYFGAKEECASATSTTTGGSTSRKAARTPA
jgi:hypothetical protein